ncbi:MAG: SipW-dependent-type signal peptide-containing protein [Clostridia bacterium]|nr:SipW-dependent-type signal peptide-containing protein [Clostridia bacterium]
MTNSKSTKRALLGSAISLVLCFAMLLGTTFAWFTDSAVSGSNVIKAGNLDIEVDYTLDGTNWTKLDGADDLFQKSLWEPGHTEVVALRIKNSGSLALKYTANMNIVDEIIGKTKTEDDIVLSEILTVESIMTENASDVTTAFTNENMTYDNKSTFKAADVLGAKDSDLLETDEVEYVIIKVDMDETVGNEANHNGSDVPSIEFGINVYATQYTHESDSFNNQYDKNAAYDTGKPVARTRILSDATTIKNPEGVEVLSKNLLIDTTDSKLGADLGKISLAAAYQFEPTLSAEEVKLSEYKTWHADFIVSVDKDIPENSIALAGYYDAWCSMNNDKWVAIPNEGLPVAANEEIRLIDAIGQMLGNSITVSLKDLSDYGNDGIGFLCGALELNDALPENTTLTVELRLYEAEDGSRDSETGNYITVKTYSYTFK